MADQKYPPRQRQCERCKAKITRAYDAPPNTYHVGAVLCEKCYKYVLRQHEAQKCLRAASYSIRHAELVSKKIANSSPHDPNLQYTHVRKQLKQFSSENTPIIFLAGARGTGKTTLAGFYLLYRLWRGNMFVSGFYQDAGVTAYKVLDKMKQGKLSDFYAELMGYDTLILDEVSQLHTPFMKEFLFEIINGRLNQNRPTMLIAPFVRMQQINRWLDPSTMRRIVTDGVVLRCTWKPLYKAGVELVE